MANSYINQLVRPWGEGGEGYVPPVSAIDIINQYYIYIYENLPNCVSTGGKHDPLPPTLGYVNNTTMNKLLKRIKMFFCPHKWVPVEYQEREFYNKFARQINFKYRGTRL